MKDVVDGLTEGNDCRGWGAGEDLTAVANDLHEFLVKGRGALGFVEALHPRDLSS